MVAIIGGCRDHWLANVAAAIDGRDPEGIHQTRVGLRRLRSALSLFKKQIPPGQRSALNTEAKWLFGELGPVRDLDVFIGSLGENPFPDASPELFADFSRVLSTGLGHQVQVVAPYRGLHKDDIIKRHAHLPLELSLTCMAPRGGVHCGACNKCNERQTAFREAGVPDKTRYGA